LRKQPLIASALTLAASVVVGLAAAAPASAAPTASISDIEYVRAALQKYSVSQDVQERLISDFAAGRRWASQTGAEPVSTEVKQVNGTERTIARFQDGSFTVADVEVSEAATDQVKPMGVTGCQSYNKAGAKAWRNCKISYDALSWSTHFFADYGYWLGPSYGCFIDSVRSFAYSGAGSFNSPKVEFITKSASGFATECKAQGTVVQTTPVFADTVGVRVSVSAKHGGGYSSRVG
jgi:hypothetical protein